MTPSSPRGFDFYLNCAVVVLAGVGITGNGTVLYALVASEQHKKNILIVYQNVFDCVTCLFVILNHFTQLFDIHLTGSVGYWLCMLLFSAMPSTASNTGSLMIIAAISVERYLKIVHTAWSKKILRTRMVYILALVIALIIAFASIIPVFLTSVVIDAVCYAYTIWNSETARIIFFMWHFLSFYVILLFIFIFCYSRILVVVRRQATVMAGHNAAGPSAAAQTQSNQARNNVVSTMILVSALYAITHLFGYVVYLILYFNPHLPSIIGEILYRATFVELAYVCIINPLIYAVNFIPVKKVLLQMIRREYN